MEEFGSTSLYARTLRIIEYLEGSMFVYRVFGT